MGTFYVRGFIRIISILIATLAVMWFFYAHDTFICEILSSIISKRNEFVTLGLKMKAGSLIDDRILPPNCLTPISLLPTGLYHMFMQPFIWSHGLFEKLFGAENLIILLLTLLSAVFFQKPDRSRRQLAAFCLVFFLLNYILIGITVPIIGALVRYKIFGLLFYIVLLTCLIDLNKIISIIQNQKNLNLGLKRVQKTFFR